MSTYVCGPLAVCRPTASPHSAPNDPHLRHCWHEQAEARLLWLYGEEGCADRDDAADADVAAWNRLGRRRAA